MKQILAALILVITLLPTEAFAVENFRHVDVGWNRWFVLNGAEQSNVVCNIVTSKFLGFWKVLLGNDIANSYIYRRCTRSLDAPAVASYNIPVLVLKYFPLDPNNPLMINTDITGTYMLEGITLNQLRDRVETYTNDLVDRMQRGSTFHGYKDSSAKPVLKYSIYEKKEFLRPILRTDNPDWGFTADHLNELRNINICDYVENKGIKEVWILMYHNTPSMDSNRYYVSPKEWNLSGSTYRVDDLPLCSKTYAVYEYNYGRLIAKAIEDHTHLIERVLEGVNSYVWNDLFVGSWGQRDFYRCGWPHCPPNTMLDCHWPPLVHNYDWTSENSVLSDCEDWRPDGSGQKKIVNCHNWHGSVCDGSDDGEKYMVWWMQNIPSKWWVWIGDYDGAKARGLGLEYF